MNHEDTEFAAHRFTPRTGFGRARDSYAVEHFRPSPLGNFNMRSHALAVFIGVAIGAVLAYHL